MPRNRRRETPFWKGNWEYPKIYTRRQRNVGFVEAIKAVKEGKKIRRTSWANRKLNAMMDGGYVSVKDEKDNLYHPWLISEADVYAQDWEISFDA